MRGFLLLVAFFVGCVLIVVLFSFGAGISARRQASGSVPAAMNARDHPMGGAGDRTATLNQTSTASRTAAPTPSAGFGRGTRMPGDTNGRTRSGRPPR